MKYSIVIPTLNEKENIVRLIQALEALPLPELEIVVADENSPDGTAEAVRAYAGSRDDIRVVSNDGPRGLSPSIVKGFASARGEFLCCMDGDLQHDPADLRRMFAAAAESDMVIGSRYCDGGGFAEKWSLSRTLISRTGAWLSRLFLGVKLTDPTSGFFVVRRSAFEAQRHLLNPCGFKIMLEMFYVLSICPTPYRIREVGIVFGLRRYGHSKLSTRVILNYLWQLWDLKRRRGVIRRGGEAA